MQKVEKMELCIMDIKGTKIEESIFIFGSKGQKWICANRKEAIENYKNQLQNKMKAEDLSILELKQNEEQSWQISEIPLTELINELY